MDSFSSFLLMSRGNSKIRHRRSSHRHNTIKIRLLNDAIINKDIMALRKLAYEPGGFINHGIRRRAWLIVLGIDVDKITDDQGFLPSPTSTTTLLLMR